MNETKVFDVVVSIFFSLSHPKTFPQKREKKTPTQKRTLFTKTRRHIDKTLLLLKTSVTHHHHGSDHHVGELGRGRGTRWSDDWTTPHQNHSSSSSERPENCGDDDDDGGDDDDAKTTTTNKMKNTRRDKDEEKRDKESRGRQTTTSLAETTTKREEEKERRERVAEMEEEEERRTRKRRKKREDDTEARLESGLETAVGAVQRNDKDAGRALEIIIAKADEAAEVGTEEVAIANATLERPK